MLCFVQPVQNSNIVSLFSAHKNREQPIDISEFLSGLIKDLTFFL